MADTSSIERSLEKHRRKKRIQIIVVCAIVLVASLSVAIYKKNVSYDKYKVLKTLDTDDGNGNQYVAFSNFFIKYGLDGISYVNGKETVWAQAYEMSNPIVDVCGNYVAVADKGGNTIYIFDEQSERGKVNTAYPIVSIEIANQGVVAALLEEDKANYIEAYDKDGDLLISHKTLLSGNGYPLSFSLSEDGTKMIVSYVCISSGSVESKVMFFNFGGVGQNEVDRVVGGMNYKTSVIPTVNFLQNNVAIAVGDNILSIYKMREKPVVQEEIKIKKEIKKLFYNSEYIGLVFENDSGSKKYKVVVYDLKGNKVMEKSVDMDFNDIKFSGKNILMYDDLNCKIIPFKGKEKFSYTFDETINAVIPTEKFREYLIIKNNKVERIRIK
ncbi:MAG: hypothetical protein E7254_01515 [Lachnospiraceae bacterium]|nr:hypothetical protein [Lachnospiraceae bacterium]